MKKMFSKTVMRKLPLAVAISLLGAATVNAVEFNFGDLSVQVDNNVSYGIAMRTESYDKGQVMNSNVGAPGQSGYGSSYNYDDGTLNYKKGDVYTSVFKWNGDLELRYQNFGAFVRARAWYDTEIMDGETRFKPIPEASKSYAGRGAEILDAFVWGDFNLGNTPLNLRLGRQVVNWGESTFIQGGINSVNPVDASAFRRPGAEIKEGLLPVNMAFASIGLTDSTSLEAFYQLQWEKTRTDPCGTFFSTIDFVADGCGPVLLSHSQDEVTGTFYNMQIVNRFEDDEPKDDGQFGLALRSYTDLFGGTEFGAYYMNIHSRMPYINGKLLVLPSTPIDPNSHRMEYQIAYPENVQIMGVSFATSLPNGASLSGEISYRPDTPMQWNAFELIFAGVPGASNYSRFFQQRLAEAGGDVSSLVGETVKGYDEFDVWQAQMTYIQFIDRVMGADRMTLIAEVGATYVPDLPNKDDARYGRSGAYGIGNTTGNTNVCNDPTSSLKNENSKYCSDEGYVTEWSGGVRVRTSLDYSNVFAGVNMSPSLMLSYDQGYGPEPGAQFIDKRLMYAVGLQFVYQNNATLDLTYTGFEGGDYDQMIDRDNVALSLKYSF